MPLQSSNIAALTSAMGDVMARFGGLRMTLTSAQTNVGDTSISVQRTAGWPTAGIIGVGADVYAYTAVSGTTFSGLTYLLGGTSNTGLANAFPINSAVVDLSRTYSVLDQVKNGYFFGTASGSDLAVLGRNLGVPLLPIVQGDTQYRALIKALAYAPRGTTYALQNALDALIGAGTYAIHQTPAKPATVIITAPYTSLQTAPGSHPAFLEGNTPITVTNQQVTLANLPAGTHQISALKVAGQNGGPPTGQDFMVKTGTTASVTGNSITLPGYTPTANSVGNRVRLSKSQQARTPGGNNDGTYTIASSSGNTVTVSYIASTATVSTTGVLTAASNVFTWPDDLGRTLTVASGPAQGTYIIAKIYDPYQTGLFDCAQYIGSVRVHSSSVQLSSAPTSAAPSAPFTVAPTFVNEGNLTFSVGGDGIAPDGTLVPISVPSNGAYSIDAQQTDGCMLAADELAQYGYPLYLDEPFSLIEGYLDKLVVAGVTLEFDFT